MQFLQPSDLGSAYSDAQQTARKSWLKYDELERLAANEVRTDLPANMPKVNDGSLSATIKKIPKRLFAKPMTGKLKAVDRDEDWIARLATVILEQRIIPNANTDATFLRKWKVAVKNSKIYGSQPIYTFFTQHGTYTGADMSLPYVRNVYLEPGKISDLASDYIFMDSWYTKLQAKRLLDKAIADYAAVEAGDLQSEDCMWDPKALQAWYDAGPSGKDSQSQTAQERTGINRNEKGLYKLSTCFNRGAEAPFYTFAPSTASKVVGTQKNTNPTGDVPIIYIYHDEDLINPYGTGLIHDAGPTQNVLDNLTQTDVLSTQIGAQPPLDIHGDRSQTNLKSLVYAPSQFWFSGNATVTPVTHTNPQFYNALPSRFSLYKSQQQFITGTFDNSVSADSGQPGFSKTDAGVNALQNQTNADDNDTQQSIADAYSRVIKSMVNIHMNNMEGSELLKLEGDQLEYLANTDLVPTDENGEPAAEQIEVIWDNVRASFEFEVDPQSSTQTNDQEQAKNIQEALQTITLPVTYYMGQDGYKFNMGEAYHSLLTKMGLENIDKIITKMTPEEKQAAQSAPFPIVDPPQIRLNSADIPPEYMPGALQNAGIQASDSPASPSYADQAKLLTAKTDAAATMQQAMQPQQIDPATGQPVQGDNPQQPTATPNDPPVQNGQQVTGQMSAPEAQEQDNQQEQPSIEQRLMEIQEEWSCDLDTAATIASAQDHGATDEEIPHILRYMTQGVPQ